MRRRGNEGTKVWHNPEIAPSGLRGRSASSGAPAQGTRGEDRQTMKAHRAALEALFAPRKEETAPAKADARARDAKAPGRIVLAPPPPSDPKVAERQRLLSKLLLAEGRPGVSKAADDFLEAGFTLPDDQDVWLQMLEHADESRVCEAIRALGALLVGEQPKRRAVLESRLRRIEQFAEDAETREGAADLRRKVSGRPSVGPQLGR